MPDSTFQSSDIRLSTDVAAIVAMILAFREYLGLNKPDQSTAHSGVSRLLAAGDTDFLLAGNPALGFVQIRYRHSAWTDSPVAEVEDLFVLAQSRGQGLGRKLLQAAVECARKRGADRVSICVNERNPGALHLYESMGFAAENKRVWGGRDLYMRLWFE